MDPPGFYFLEIRQFDHASGALRYWNLEAKAYLYAAKPKDPSAASFRCIEVSFLVDQGRSANKAGEAVPDRRTPSAASRLKHCRWGKLRRPGPKNPLKSQLAAWSRRADRKKKPPPDSGGGMSGSCLIKFCPRRAGGGCVFGASSPKRPRRAKYPAL